jgi:cytochrome c oxidase assembly protein subunit 11
VSAAARPDPRRTALAAAAIALGMLALAYASVPLYRLFCQVTGFGGTTQRFGERAAPTADAIARAAGHVVTVRFDANTAPGMGWRFRPSQVRQEIALGGRNMAFYTAHNPFPTVTHGTATFNVTPASMGRYFVKIDCFCFREQTLSPGQTVQMPVLYYLDPAILDDPDARRVEEVTLSYTFFPMDPAPAAPAAVPTATKPQG